MFVAHLVASIILNRKQFDFFVLDKPLQRYHFAHPSTSNFYGVAFNFDFRTQKLKKLNETRFTLTFFDFIYQT